MHVSSFEELSLAGLKDIYDAEYQITEALPEMAKAATTPELKRAFQEHLRQTENQIQRLDRAFEMLGQKAERKSCVAMKGIIAEGNQHLKETDEGPLRDAALTEAAQKVEHYEMAAYGTARTWAMRLGQDQIAQLLEETLREEEETDKKLTGIAESVVNVRAQTQQR